MKNIFLASMTDRENRGRGKGTRTGATKTAFSPLTVVLLIVLILYALTLIGLLFWAVITSFKSQAEFRINILGFPDKWVWNYGEVFRSFQVSVMAEDGTRYVSMGGMILNSVIYSFGCAIASTITPCITAYLCAKFPFRFSKVVYFIVIVTMALPIVGSLPSEMLVARTFGVYDRIWLLWIMKANFLGIYFLVFHAEFKSIPKEYFHDTFSHNAPTRAQYDICYHAHKIHRILERLSDPARIFAELSHACVRGVHPRHHVGKQYEHGAYAHGKRRHDVNTHIGSVFDIPKEDNEQCIGWRHKRLTDIRIIRRTV